MTLDPELQAAVDLMNGLPRAHQQSVAAAREQFEMLGEFGDREREVVAEARDIAVPGPAGPLRTRLYLPVNAENPPLLVYYHGGGHTIGSIASYDRVCRALCRRSGCAVASVEYRLAPEARFPAAMEDAYAAAAWLATHGIELGVDGSRLAVGGDSAGGNLAAVVCLAARDRGAPTIRFQLLVYPVTDFAGCLREDERTESNRQFATGLLLEAETITWFSRNYLRDDADIDNPLASPLRAPDLAGLPPALVMTGELDPLRDEGEAYAARLLEAGVDARLTRYEGQIHGFFSMFDLAKRAGAAMDDAAAAVREALRA